MTAEEVEQTLQDQETDRINRVVRLTFSSSRNDNADHSACNTQMSRTRSIEGDQDPSRKSTRSNTLLPRASTFSQTIQVITNKLQFSTSPKLRCSRRKVPYERAPNSLQESYQGEENTEETFPPFEDDSIETEVFFKEATTTSKLYQVNHSLDDTLPYFDPLLDLQRDSLTPLHSFNITPPSPFDAGFVRQTRTPPLPQVPTTQQEAVPGTSSNTTHMQRLIQRKPLVPQGFYRNLKTEKKQTKRLTNKLLQLI